MKLKKKILSVIISTLLILSAFPFSLSASAAEVGYEDMFFTVDNSTYTAELSTYSGNGSELVIPDTVYGYTVTSIAPRVFYENKTLEEVYLPDTINSIGLYAFAFCEKLKSTTLGENVTFLADNVFFGCPALEQAVVNCNIETLPTGTFEKCAALNSVTLSDSISALGNSSFMGCSSLEDLPTENIVSYGSNCFQGTNAAEVVIADGVTYLPWMCFAQCNNLTWVTIPESVSSINSTAFYQILDNIEIKCFCDSFAHSFAVENTIDHMILDRQLGDVNFDGAVDVFDATEIQKYAAESTDFTPDQFELGDINKDGYCDVMDALLVQKSVVRKYDIPPIIIRY